MESVVKHPLGVIWVTDMHVYMTFICIIGFLHIGISYGACSFFAGKWMRTYEYIHHAMSVRSIESPKASSGSNSSIEGKQTGITLHKDQEQWWGFQWIARNINIGRSAEVSGI